MARLTFRENLSISVASCLAISAYLAAPIQARQQVDSSPQASENEETPTNTEIIVTGTRIRGVAPVGSALLQLDRTELAKSGLLSTADILNKVPAVLSLGSGNSYAGGSGQGGSDLNALSFNKSPNLRGFGPQATLSLVNGHRVPYDGANMNTFDGDNIPTQMLQRVDIVADGTSAIFGADAITGTVNYVMRAPFTGLEAYGQYSTAKGQQSYQLTAVGGYDWGSGGIVISYQHAYMDRLKASSRPSLYSDDFTAFGGPASSTQASPGNIVVNGVTYAIPTGQNGTTLTLAQLGTAGSANRTNVWTGYDAIPEMKRDQVAMNFKQDITDGLQIYADGFYTNRDVDIALYNAASNNRVTLTIPNSNFYSPCNRSLVGAPAALVAACGTGALTVNYNTINDTGPGKRTGFTRTWEGTIGATIGLFGDWKGNINGSIGQNRGRNVNTLYFGNGLPFQTAALGGTTASTAFNPFCDGTSQSCGNGAFTAAVFAGMSLTTDTTYDNRVIAGNVDGSLMDLPGGKLRVAIGGEHVWSQFINANDFATTVNTRKVNSAYAELYVPVFGADNAIGGFSKLELTGAIRVDDYNDVGSTTNPKFGFNWMPVDSVKVHGSYGTSFRAPGLVDNDPNSQRGYLVPTFPGSVISPNLCASCAASPTDIAIYQALGGAARNLKPETSTSWSLGIDFAPPQSGINVSVTYWNVKYIDQVATPVYNAGAYQAINQGFYNSQIIYNPTYFPQFAAGNPVAFFGPYPYAASNANCSAVAGKNITTQSLYNTLISCLNAGGNGPILGVPSTNVAAITNGHRLNSSSTHGDGIDISASYTWGEAASRFRLGVLASYTNSWKVSAIQGAPVIDQVNRFGYPLRFRARFEAGWSGDVGPGNLSAAAFLNYANAYKIDQTLLPLGVASTYTDISAYTTIDAALSYDFGDSGGILSGFSATVSAQNLFDRLPPRVINTGSTASIKFDPSNGSPVGRVVQFQIAKKF